ncbi:MAG: hypothetical protein PHU94_01330 [Bacilli bacterium]|nr:hypothetical protein [Bacilli bacterium]MDD4718863.1 hypothetical protein [Bacilli bacterium]
MKEERINKIKQEITSNSKIANSIYDVIMKKCEINKTSFYEEFEKHKELYKENQKKDIKLLTRVLLIVSLIIGFIFIINYVVSSKKINKVNEAFTTILNDNSNNKDLKNSIDEIKKVSDTIDCTKAILKKNKFYQLCLNDKEYIQYAKARIVFNNFPSIPTYDDYEKLYNELNDNYYSNRNEKFNNFKSQMLNKYYNFLVDKILKGDYLKVLLIADDLGGIKTIEYITNIYGGKNTCSGYLNADYANIFLFAASFNEEDIDKRVSNWHLLSYDGNLEYSNKILNYASTKMVENNFKYNGETLTSINHAKTILKNYDNKIPPISECEKLVKKGEALSSPPKIGMTQKEVLSSSWGSPSKKNKTTTIYGTKEQWVYSGYRYVYFDEYGYVTTIQDY